MSLEVTINNDIKQAMRDKNQGALRALRAIKSVILLAKTEKGGNDALSEEQETKILMKQAKQRKDTIATFKEQGRDDLAQEELEELVVIEKYLPEMMDEAEVRGILTAIVAETGASSMQDMGKVMGKAMQQLSGKADGKMISAITKELLNK